MRLRKRIDDGSLSLGDLVDVTIKSHHNGSLNPNAQFQKEFTAEQIIGGRPIADPLTLPMCSAIADGAAAVVVTRADLAPGNGRPQILIRASQAGSGFTTDGTVEPSASTLAARRAYEEAGVGEPGGASELLASGATQIGGRIAVNPSGGLCSRGHPVGATGLAQTAELVWQLRGEAGERQSGQPRFALAQNSGGWLEGESAATNVHIFERAAAWN
jgi:acetyl-CoA acetyltransferase